MTEEFLTKYDIKPYFNLDWYNNKEQYSDGDIEEVIVKLIAENEPENYIDAVADNFSWATFYHLTGTRSNIINWYPFKADSSVLEIGCGFGAITHTLCDKCGKVTAVELSKRRAQGALLRCRNYSNLEIIVGNLNDIVFEEKFDYITLIGVLECQGRNTDSKKPYKDFLSKVKSLLKPDGKLLIAIENQYGIKYWCGMPEDHTGMPFDGMNDYSLSKLGIRTFSRKKLDKLIKESGFKETFFYYPMPDYKLPQAIFSEKYLPTKIFQGEITPYNSGSQGSVIAREEYLYNELIDNGVFEFFANSFLVECSDVKVKRRLIFAKMNDKRYPEYQLGTAIDNCGNVVKYPLVAEANDFLDVVVRNTDELLDKGIKVVPFLRSKGMITSKFEKDECLDDVLKRAYSLGKTEEIYRLFDLVWNDIKKAAVEIPSENNIMYTFEGTFEKKDYGPVVETGYLDMITRNALYKGDSIVWIDQEWTLECVPLNYVMFRAVFFFYFDYKPAEEILPAKKLMERYGFAGVYDDYYRLETFFGNVVNNQTHVKEYDCFANPNESTCLRNVRKLM